MLTILRRIIMNNTPKLNSNLNFGEAIEVLKSGGKVARLGWNGRGMWLMLVTSTRPILTEGSPYHKAGLLGRVTINDHIDMFTAQGDMQPGWLASQTDMLADDWMVID